jgi:hypothetical protein
MITLSTNVKIVKNLFMKNFKQCFKAYYLGNSLKPGMFLYPRQPKNGFKTEEEVLKFLEEQTLPPFSDNFVILKTYSR